jgi:hypothetical protein
MCYTGLLQTKGYNFQKGFMSVDLRNSDDWIFLLKDNGSFL